MHNACSDQDLAACFVELNVDKKMKIQNKFDQCAIYETRLRDLLSPFNMFHQVTDDMINCFIMSGLAMRPLPIPMSYMIGLKLRLSYLYFPCKHGT